MIYLTSLQVAPFILGPGGRTRKESTVLLGPRDLSVQEDEFTQVLLSPISRLRANLPVATHLVRFSHTFVASNVLRNRTVQIGQNRRGLSLMYGVCFRAGALREHHDVVSTSIARIHLFLRDEFGLQSSEPNLEPIILRLQQDVDPDDILPEGQVEALLAEFERDYGLDSRPMFERRRFWSEPTLPQAFKRHVGHVTTWATVDTTLEHWKRVEASLLPNGQPQSEGTLRTNQVEVTSHLDEVFMQVAIIIASLAMLALTFFWSFRWSSELLSSSPTLRFVHRGFFLMLALALLFLTIFSQEQARVPTKHVKSVTRIATLVCLSVASATLVVMILIAGQG